MLSCACGLSKLIPVVPAGDDCCIDGVANKLARCWSRRIANSAGVHLFFAHMMFISFVYIGCKLTSVCQTRRRGAKRLRSDCPSPDSTSSVILESV